MKKRVAVLFPANEDSGWMGGIYYIRNIVYQFMKYAKEADDTEYHAYIWMSESVRDVFNYEEQFDNLHFIIKKTYPWSKGGDFFSRNMREVEMLLRLTFNRIKYIYPSFAIRGLNKNRTIAWIPDFQHVIYPQFFSDEEKSFRDEYYGDIAKYHSKLVLSSKDAYDTYVRLYPDYCDNVSVVPFASAIEPRMTAGNPQEIRRKYGVESRDFFIVANQFYRHKNHKLVLEAVKKAIDEGNKDITVICTGMQNDVKDPTFYPEIERMMDDYGLRENVKILGLIPREEQLVLMKESIAVVQPSLFEGWGTCTEDGKTLGKIVVLSDIPVHIEQADERAVIFGKDSADELKAILIRLWNQYNGKDKVSGYNLSPAIEYGRCFAEVLD